MSKNMTVSVITRQTAQPKWYGNLWN